MNLALNVGCKIYILFRILFLMSKKESGFAIGANNSLVNKKKTYFDPLISFGE